MAEPGNKISEKHTKITTQPENDNMNHTKTFRLKALGEIVRSPPMAEALAAAHMGRTLRFHKNGLKYWYFFEKAFNH